MSDRKPKKASIEVSSGDITDQLVAIKDRLNAIETIQSISNAPAVRKHVEEHLKTDAQKRIMGECREPRTRSYLRTRFNYNSDQALAHHVTPLTDADLLRKEVQEDGTIVLAWSNLFGRLPKTVIKSILGERK